MLRNDSKVLSPFDYPANSEGISKLIGISQRTGEDDIKVKHKDLAAKIQSDFTKALIKKFEEALQKTQCEDFVYLQRCSA